MIECKEDPPRWPKHDITKNVICEEYDLPGHVAEYLINSAPCQTNVTWRVNNCCKEAFNLIYSVFRFSGAKYESLI